MRREWIWVCGWIVGCGGDKTAAVLRYPIADMHGLDDNARWIWRTDETGSVDSGRSEALDEDALVWASHDGSGAIELRQGATWETGVWWGGLQFDGSSADLVLVAWDLPARAGDRVVGEGTLRMADADAADGDRHTTSGFRCDTRINQGARTFFGTFDSTVTLDCQGSNEQPSGRWTFARDVGLVQLRSGRLESLDLVAPGW